ncbi:uncharacterized protein QC761_0027010 [Podospora bellae-mahoneyi]|uniref:Protein kinase domain-containing protein n=1 Tax=Podospora bellae-mahoneyi TaxID=2093777 RepID=A0ABR0FWJ2_9PEZI|nr:hypothetical protein QC761_0027010 [Podospora bellae-mahoneyi]
MDEDDGQPLQVASPPLPPSLYSTNIVKEFRIGGQLEVEFDREKQVYDVLKPLQGTGVYDGSPALVLLFIRGKTIYELLRESRLLKDKDLEALRNSLQDALRALTVYGVEYTDMKTDNFLLTDYGANVWEGSTNNANVDYLMYQLSEPRRLALRRSTEQGLLPIPGAAKGQLVHHRG